MVVEAPYAVRTGWFEGVCEDEGADDAKVAGVDVSRLQYLS